MSRITEKREKPLTTKWEDVSTSYYKIKGDDTGVAISEIERLNKLGKLEDLEEEFGCPLEVRCKVTTGTYIYDENGNEYEVEFLYSLSFMATDGKCDDNGITIEAEFLWKDYKKTWWLKEDRSE